MGDDNEIRQLIRQESESFLKSALHDSKDVVKSYDFDVEYAKTRQNRSFVVIGATLITIIVLSVAALVVTRFIEARIAAAPVDVAAFDDLNLKDILDTSKRNESDRQRVKLELTQLQYDLSSSISAEDRDLQSSIETIRARSNGSTDERAQVATATAAAAARKRRLNASYVAEAAKKNAELAAIQKKIDQYDSRMLEQANKQEARLQSERMVFDLEKKQQAAVYESRIANIEAARKRDIATLKRQKDELAASLTLRYNPNFADDRSQGLLSGSQADVSTSMALDPLHPYLSSAGVLDPSTATRLDRSFADFEFLSAKLRAVPYINSVPPSLTRIESEARSSISSYRSALAAAGEGLANRDAQIAERDARIAVLVARAQAAETSLEQFRFAVSSFARASREGGYVIDPRDSSKILVYLDAAIPVADGASGYIVRGEKSIATVTFHVDGGKTFANLSRLETGETLLAFDTILVDASKEAEK
jgi:hypothetical protein